MEFRASLSEDFKAPVKFRSNAANPSSEVNEIQIIRLQALYRGYLDRKQYHILQESQPSHERIYLGSDEVLETLHKTATLSPIREVRTHQYKSGAEYSGEWRGGFRDGQGTIKYPCGSRFEGTWSFGYPFGLGSFTHSDGEVYTGYWTVPYPQCHPSLRIIGKESVAKWKDGLPNGFGDYYIEWLWYKIDLTYRTGKRWDRPLDRLDQIQFKLLKMKDMIARTKLLETAAFRTRFKGGSRVVSTRKYSDGGVYTGEFLLEKRDGYGKMVWNNGDEYSGEWKEDKQRGWGASKWLDGATYVGTYAGHKKDGVGEYVWTGGKRYLGEWKKNRMQGIGEHTWENGSIYIGEWENGLMHGYGKMTTFNGMFEGFWKKGKQKKAIS